MTKKYLLNRVESDGTSNPVGTTGLIFYWTTKKDAKAVLDLFNKLRHKSNGHHYELEEISE